MRRAIYKYIKADYEQNKYIKDPCSKHVALFRYRYYSGENHSTQGGVHRAPVDYPRATLSTTTITVGVVPKT
jgi:hypothetical protein